MLKVTIRMVKPGEEERVRAWMAELMTRKDEVRETFKQEKVRHEQAILLPVEGGMALIYAIEAEDIDYVYEAYEKSTLKIDAEHKVIMGQVLGELASSELLYECTLE